MNERFETRIQYLKYQVLKEVAKEAWEEDLVENVLNIPKKIIPGKTPTMRCCVYKERAILQERVQLAMGGNRANPNIIEVIDIACDECPMGGYEVTNSCRGCLAQRCKDACPRDAIVSIRTTMPISTKRSASTVVPVPEPASIRLLSTGRDRAKMPVRSRRFPPMRIRPQGSPTRNASAAAPAFPSVRSERSWTSPLFWMQSTIS